MKYKYGVFSHEQFTEATQKLRKRIFFLLLIVDPKTRNEYEVDIELAFAGLFRELDGLNSVLFEPAELVRVISLLEAALIEYKKPDFSFWTYRKLILDAGSEVEKIKEVL